MTDIIAWLALVLSIVDLVFQIYFQNRRELARCPACGRRSFREIRNDKSIPWITDKTISYCTSDDCINSYCEKYGVSKNHVPPSVKDIEQFHPLRRLWKKLSKRNCARQAMHKKQKTKTQFLQNKEPL